MRLSNKEFKLINQLIKLTNSHSFNRESLLALFNLAWANKIQLPVLITVCFLALDIRLQLEINIFWEPPRNVHRPPRDRGDRGHNLHGQRNNEVHPSLVAANLVHRERQLRAQERVRRTRDFVMRETPNSRLSTQPLAASTPISDENNGESDYSPDEREHASSTNVAVVRRKRRKLLKKKEVKVPVNLLLSDTEEITTDDENTDEEDNDSNEDTELSSDDENDDDDDDDDNEGGARPGPAFGGFNDDDHHDFFGDHDGDDYNESDDDTSGTPLVVELEIRQRPVFNNFCTEILTQGGIASSNLFKYEIMRGMTSTTNVTTTSSS